MRKLVVLCAAATGLAAATLPAEARVAMVGGQNFQLVKIQGHINTSNCLGVKGGAVRLGQMLLITDCRDNADQTSWVFGANGWLANAGATAPLCVGINGKVGEGSHFKLVSCGSTAVTWGESGGRIKMVDREWCLDADSGVNTEAVVRGCAQEFGVVHDPRRSDQYWDITDQV